MENSALSEIWALTDNDAQIRESTRLFYLKLIMTLRVNQQKQNLNPSLSEFYSPGSSDIVQEEINMILQKSK